MNNNRLDDITYDENWLSFDEPLDLPENTDEYKVEQEQHKKPDKKKEGTFPTLIGIQLLICLAIAFVIFILKSMDSDVYNKISDFYNDRMRSTLVSNKKFEDIDLSSYFNSTNDQATPSQYEN